MMSESYKSQLLESLNQLSKQELVEIIVSQQKQIQELTQEIEKLKLSQNLDPQTSFKFPSTELLKKSENSREREKPKVLPFYYNSCFKKIRSLRKFTLLRKVLGYCSIEPVIQNRKTLTVRGRLINYHDLYHIEISKLERIKIGKDMVSGIHGINSPHFHELPISEEYDSSLDEARVAIHEWLTRPSIANTLKILVWINWFVLNEINPIDVICQHRRTLR